jgi:hypothetical protein
LRVRFLGQDKNRHPHPTRARHQKRHSDIAMVPIRKRRRAMKPAAMIFALALVGSQALAQEQTRIFGPDGRSLGTAAPYGTGSVRYRDSRGRTTFTTTTTNGVTRFYDSGGHLTATVIGSRRR